MSTHNDRGRPTRRQRHLDTSGFTLVEVLVAFTIMAMLLSVLFRGVVTMRAGALAYGNHMKQQILARSILEDALATRHLEAGRYSGTRNGHRWTLIAKSIDLSGQMPKRDPDDTGARPPPNGTPQSVSTSGPRDAEAGKPFWQPQKLIVRLETKSRPVEIETIRLVKPEKAR